MINRVSVLKDELGVLGYRHTSLAISGVAYTKFYSPKGVTWLYRDDGGAFPMPYNAASYVLNNKLHAARYVATKDVRTPQTVMESSQITSVEDYRRILGLHEDAVLVVKPVDGTLSKGLSANVTTTEQLQAAIVHAKKQSAAVLVQERVVGEELRFAYVGKKLHAVIYKQKPQIVGDGRSSIRDLVLDENRARLALRQQWVTYPQLSFDAITQFGVDLGAVPDEGRRVYLGDSTMIEDGASFYNLIDTVHDSYKELAWKIAEDFGGGYLAVDMLVEDYTQPADDTNYAFLEYNNLPAMILFYSCRDNSPVTIGRELARYIDQALHIDIE